MAGTITTGNFPQTLSGGGGKKMRKSAKLRDMDPKGGGIKKPKVKKPPKAKKSAVKKPSAKRPRARAAKPKTRGKAIGAGMSALTEMPGMPGPMEPPRLGG